MPSNWTPEAIAARGFDPSSGRRVQAVATWKQADQLQHKPAATPSLSASARSYLKPEQLLQVQVIDELRPKLVDGARLFAINGELPGGGKLFRLWQAVRRAMGYEVGLPDVQACYRSQAYFLELKRPRGLPDLLGHRKAAGQLSPEQKAWAAWAKSQGFPWAVCRSVQEVETALAGWRLLR